MNRNTFTIMVGLLALVAAMLVLGTGGASATHKPPTSMLQAQSASQSQQPDAPLAPVTTTFTYQGYLAQSGTPANGQHDFEFRLFDAASGGNQIGPIKTLLDQTVSNGVFTVPLDFGSLDGTAGWLEIRVRSTGSVRFILLTPRQQLTPTPYAMSLRPGTIIKDVSESSNGNLLVITGTIRSALGGQLLFVDADGELSNGHAAIFGRIDKGIGIAGRATGATSTGVRGSADGVNGSGVQGVSSGEGGVGIRGISFQKSGWAGVFQGDVAINGNLSKGGGSFKIDHPLDPANKYLYHSFVESPDMMNIYNGNVTTDGKGEAVVIMPAWFDALNKDFRYQLTPIGQFAQAIVGEEMNGNRFTIRTDKPNVKVSWQVTGIREDAYADAHRIPVEADKQGDEKGKYLYPTEQGQPESKGIGYEELQRVREEAEQNSQTQP